VARVVLRPRAEADLTEIWEYIAGDDAAAADEFIDFISGKLKALAENPSMGRERPELTPLLRSFPVKRYVVFYLPAVNGIEVVRVLHAARDLDLLLN